MLSSVDGALVPMPIDRTTIKPLYDPDFDERGVAGHLAKVCENRAPIVTGEDAV
ncbi:MAG: hypothetical protein HY749_20435 [Gammaproteobacteria bacterium]|nr:hypothetical protein [Gammaproteobacteria bacterium]